MQHLTLLTGGSRGMGLAMARQLLQPGSHLLTISRQPAPQLEPLAQARGAVLEQWAADLAEPGPVADRLAEWLRALPAARYASATLINNAGVVTDLGVLEQASSAGLSRALRVGLEAALVLTAAFLQGTEAWGAARKVLNISSGLGRRALAGSASYCAAKAGMDHFSRAVALEQAQRPNGARIVSLAPGIIDTDMQRELRNADPARFPEQAMFAGWHSAGQLTPPEDAARSVLAYLARPDFGQSPIGDVRDA